MKILQTTTITTAYLLMSATCFTHAFVGQQPSTKGMSFHATTKPTTTPITELRATKNNRFGLSDHVQRWMGTVAIVTSIWGGLPAVDVMPFAPDHHQQKMHLLSPQAAVAKEMASGTGSRVNKDPESLLRYGLPINNKDATKLQGFIEDIKTNIGSKRKSAAIDGVKNARTKINSSKDKLANACNTNSKLCDQLLTEMQDELIPLEQALRESMDSFQGSEQERKALDKAYESQIKLASKISQLEEAMVPKGYTTTVPSDYDDLPQLQGGRATVEFKLSKPDNAPFDVNGVNFKEAKLKMVIDGYTAPVTGGNFVDLVSKGFYKDMKIQRSDGFVVQTGDPDGEADGYVGTGGKALGNGPHGERLIPLETFIRGDSAPFYESTIEDEGRGGQAVVLPFSSYGAMGWARDEYDANSGSSQFFWLLFDSDLTPAGKNVLDGRYPCFGYVVEGADFLQDIKEGDIITSAKVTSGMEFLKQPK